MAHSEKPRITVSEIRRLSSEEGWEDQQIAEYFGIKAIDITRVRSAKGIIKKKVFKPRFILVDDEEEAGVQIEGANVETPMEATAVEPVSMETVETVETQVEDTAEQEERVITEEQTVVAETTSEEDSLSTGW